MIYFLPKVIETNVTYLALPFRSVKFSRSNGYTMASLVFIISVFKKVLITVINASYV